MLETIFWVLLGAFVGWHFPEPSWAATIKAKVLETVNGFRNRK